MAVIARQAFRYYAAAPMDDLKAPLPAERPARADPSPSATTPAERSFARRALIAVSLAIGLSALALFLWYSLYVLLLAFAAVLVAVLLRGSAEWVAKKLRIRVGWALGVVLLSVIGFFILVGYFAAPSIAAQGERLAERLPQSLEQAEDTLRKVPWGRRLLGEPGAPAQAGAQPPAQQPPASQPTSQPTSQPSSQPTLVEKVVEAGTSGKAFQSATRILNQVLQGLLALFVILVSGIYMAAQPRMYVNGVLMLTPHARRPRYREVLNRLAFTLRWWMIGQLVPMAVIGVITAVGLKVIGVELWFILGLLAALLNFIPNFGPLISGVPAFLLALAESPQKAMWVVLLYIVSQNLEGYVLTPLVQRKAVEMPPALLILFQVLAGLLLGAIGVMLAAPLLAVIVVATKMLYVEDVLGDEVDVPGDSKEKPG
jgi:predicted PurR-regulated permease PerM